MCKGCPGNRCKPCRGTRQHCCAPTGASEGRGKRGVFSLAERIIDRGMEFRWIQNAIHLLGQGAAAGPRHEVKADERLQGTTGAPVEPKLEVAGPRRAVSAEERPQGTTGAPVEPKLEVAWGSFHGGAWSHLAALF